MSESATPRGGSVPPSASSRAASSRGNTSGPQTEASAAGEDTSLIGNTRNLIQLTPRQVSDEFTLAKRELMDKGKKVGIGAGFFAVCLVILGLLVIALVVAAIMGLATVMPAWLAALIVAAFFLILIIIGALVGLRYVKSAMPFKPEEAMRGLRYDLGVLKEGAGFDPARLDEPEPRPEAEEEDKAKAEDAEEPEPEPEVTDEELRERIQKRREHLIQLRTDLGEQTDIKKQWQNQLDEPFSLVNQTKRYAVPSALAAAVVTAVLIIVRKLLRSDP